MAPLFFCLKQVFEDKMIRFNHNNYYLIDYRILFIDDIQKKNDCSHCNSLHIFSKECVLFALLVLC